MNKLLLVVGLVVLFSSFGFANSNEYICKLDTLKGESVNNLKSDRTKKTYKNWINSNEDELLITNYIDDRNFTIIKKRTGEILDKKLIDENYYLFNKDLGMLVGGWTKFGNYSSFEEAYTSGMDLNSTLKCSGNLMIAQNTNSKQKKQETKQENEVIMKKSNVVSTQDSQMVTQVLDKQKIKEELTYYKELFEEELIEKSEYDELRKALLAGIKEGSVTKTIIMNKPDNVVINSQNDLSKIQEQLALEKRKVEAMESQAQAAQTTNKIIKEQERKKGWNALMQLGLGIASGNLGPGGNKRQTNCYDSASGFNCTTYDW